MNIFDSSALLCLLLAEQGADEVADALEDPSCCSAANWSEVCQKTLANGLSWASTSTLLELGYQLRIEPVTPADAVRAAELWVETPHYSLGDRLCLATAERLDATVWTADTAWGESTRIRQVRPR